MTIFENEECSCCHKRHVDIRTEVITPSLEKPNGIKKAIFLLCEDHINCDTDKIEYLALLKSMNVQHKDLRFDTCASPHDSAGSAQKGVSVTHIKTNTVASYNKEEYQYFNKIRAVQKLKSALETNN